ncbi:calcium channel protein, partial [Tulasnella sp. 417]
MPATLTTNDEAGVGSAPVPSSSSGLQYQLPYPSGQATRPRKPRELSQTSLDPNASAVLTGGEERASAASCSGHTPKGEGGNRTDRPMGLEDESPDQKKRNASLPQPPSERLKGRTLGVFGPQSVVRRAMFSVFLWRWTEPVILLLVMFNAVVLAIQAHRSVFDAGRAGVFFKTWEDYALFTLFIIFTFEAFARMLVTGLVLDPTIPWSNYQLVLQNFKATSSTVHSHLVPRPSDATAITDGALFKLCHNITRLHSSDSPYLRNSWNRIDFIAVTSFWIMFALCVTGAETLPTRHLYIFRALSVLRVTRLLAVTDVVPDGEPINLQQSCGGHIDSFSMEATGYYTFQGEMTLAPKGFICPLGQVCQEQDSNPHNGIQSFDNILLGALQVVTIAGAKQWSPSMYRMMDSDFRTASIFFIVCIIILNFWLVNLFVAVIISAFRYIRVQAKKSGFGAGTSGPVIDEMPEEWTMMGRQRARPRPRIQEWYLRTHLGWVVLVFADLVVQGTKTATSSAAHLRFLDRFEIVTTIAFDVEMVGRIAGYSPNWREFNRQSVNWFDLFLAVTTSIIQIPPIHDWQYYAWLTAFQLIRFYRVILAMPRLRPFVLRVFRHITGLWNMILLMMIVNFLGALIAVQLFRGDVGADNHMNFRGIYSSFLAISQVFSSENWTDILYLTADASAPFKQNLIAVLFFVGWFFVSNFILLQVFIVIFNENFEMSEEQKRGRQFDEYVRRGEPQIGWMERWNPYRFIKAAPESAVTGPIPPGLARPLGKAGLVQDRRGRRKGYPYSVSRFPFLGNEMRKGKEGDPRRLFDLDEQATDTIPLTSLKPLLRESGSPQAILEENARHRMDFLSSAIDESSEPVREHVPQNGAFIMAHPTYDKTFWVLPNGNPLRRLCQKLVSPAGGQRIFGTPPSSIAQPCFRLIIVLAIIGGTIAAAIATPTYRRQYYIDHGPQRITWFDLVDIVFACVLILEFLVKIVADGFIFTPDAYLLSVCNVVDFIILIASLVNMITTIVKVGGVSHATRALKAFRALRFITSLSFIKDTFHSVLFVGTKGLIEAALLALLYMVPYAIWGLNIFSGLMFACNDDKAAGKGGCTGEYFSQPVEGVDIRFLAPRSWDRPSPSTTFTFDSFGSSFMILFEIASCGGWTDVLGVAMDLVGRDLQPRLNHSRENSLFFLFYHLSGVVIIVTLFVSTQTFTSSPINQALVNIAIRILGFGLRSFRADRWNLFDVFILTGSFAATVLTIRGSNNSTVKQFQKLFLLCITFKLVQRNYGLNRLLKALTWNLTTPLKLLLLWIVFFLFFAIIFVEVFGLTRWGDGETHTQNYQDFSNALIMLASMSTGTVSYPACTNYGKDNLDSDCGSRGWAYSLFIAWNLLSMYIFVNMFTGLVVKGLPWIFQPSNSEDPIGRHEIRAFKKAWAEFDRGMTGYLTSSKIIPFLSKLSGGFEVRIYPIEWSVAEIIKWSQANPNEPTAVYPAPVISNRSGTNNIDLRKLGRTISQIDQGEIRRRRATFLRLYYEAMITAEPGRGISFTNMILIVARWKMINEDSALSLDEMLQRQVTNERVKDLVNRDRAISFIKMITSRRRYLAILHEMAASRQAEPEIIPVGDKDMP